jgi:hypothetical protein
LRHQMVGELVGSIFARFRNQPTSDRPPSKADKLDVALWQAVLSTNTSSIVDEQR